MKPRAAVSTSVAAAREQTSSKAKPRHDDTLLDRILSNCAKRALYTPARNTKGYAKSINNDGLKMSYRT